MTSKGVSCTERLFLLHSWNVFYVSVVLQLFLVMLISLLVGVCRFFLNWSSLRRCSCGWEVGPLPDRLPLTLPENLVPIAAISSGEPTTIHCGVCVCVCA